MSDDRIVRDASVCAREPVIRGTRVLVRIILGHLLHGASVEAIVREFPTVTEDDVRAVVAFAAGSALRESPHDRMRLVEDFQKSSPPQTTDSTEILRRDRETR